MYEHLCPWIDLETSVLYAGEPCLLLLVLVWLSSVCDTAQLLTLSKWMLRVVCGGPKMMRYLISFDSRIHTTDLRNHSFLATTTTSTNIMGGDDLDDDDNQWIQPVRGSGSTNPHDSEGDNDRDNSSSGPLEMATTIAKRRPPAVSESTDETTLETKKPRIEAARSSSSLAQARLLVQAGIDIQDQDSRQCTQFLSTMIQHYTLVVQHTHSTDDDNTNDTTTATDKSMVPSTKLLAQYCLGRSSSSLSNGTLMESIKELVAVKQLKQWKVVGSPCIVRCFAHAPIRTCASTLVRAHGRRWPTIPFRLARATPQLLCAHVCHLSLSVIL
jgi:hypothetical protein